MNRLAREKSPYLLQHAENPVDWYPWGEEAFRRARELDRPILLSVGYSTCHWCHVMEHESFQDGDVARALNDSLVAIKVDREERPDVDEQYMTVCTLLTGSGGWPLTVLLTPQARPFFAATYLGRTVLLDLVSKVRVLWADHRREVEVSAGGIVEALRNVAGETGSGSLPTAGTLAKGFSELYAEYDEAYAGFGHAPKFPMPHNLTFLIRYASRTGDKRALRMALETLSAMRRGGLYDHLGFGFHRYSTDERWLVPHFEKMLYDQALLALAFLEAYQATGEREHAETARQVLEYVRRDLLLPEGALASAEDADSEGVEGKFYVWSYEETERALGPDGLRDLVRLSGVAPEGNYRDPFGHVGGNILHLPAAGGEPFPDSARGLLFRLRCSRVRPLRDDKILTDWNGLAIAALARAARVLGEDRYRTMAEGAAGFILTRLRRPDRRLLHRYRAGEAAISAYAADYAYLIWGLLELYETTFAVPHLSDALALATAMVDLFVESQGPGLATLYLTARDADPLLVRPRGASDGALPSAVSVAVHGLLRVGRMTGRVDLEETARSLIRALAGQVEGNPRGHTYLLGALDLILGPVYEVVVTGKPGATDTVALLEAARSVYRPGAVYLYRSAPDDRGLARIAPFTGALVPKDGRATAYVCRNHACELPTTDPGELVRRLGG